MFEDAVQSVCKQRLCLHFSIQNTEFYWTTIYIFMILEQAVIALRPQCIMQK
jgi:hypothetical protein